MTFSKSTKLSNGTTLTVHQAANDGGCGPVGHHIYTWTITPMGGTTRTAPGGFRCKGGAAALRLATQEWAAMQ